MKVAVTIGICSVRLGSYDGKEVGDSSSRKQDAAIIILEDMIQVAAIGQLKGCHIARIPFQAPNS